MRKKEKGLEQCDFFFLGDFPFNISLAKLGKLLPLDQIGPPGFNRFFQQSNTGSIFSCPSLEYFNRLCHQRVNKSIIRWQRKPNMSSVAFIILK